MRIDLDDHLQNRHTIDTADPELAGRWFSEKAAMLMSVNASMPDCRLRIWPSNEKEARMIGRQSYDSFLTPDSLLKLSGHILQFAQQLSALAAASG